MSAGRAVLLIIVGTALLRLILAGATGLGMDESYMAGNARQFALGYLDHPPLHVWIVGAAGRLFGTEAPLLLRLPFIVLFAGSTWLMYRLTAMLFTPAAGVWAVIAFNLTPVFTLSFASWILPDGPAVFFLLAAAIVVARILLDETPPSHPTWWWLAAGLLGGLALLSKYNAVFLFAGVFVFLLTVPAARRQLATPGPWLGALVAVAVFSPVVLWNLQNGQAGFLLQVERLPGSTGAGLGRLAENVGGQALYLTPWLMVPLGLSLYRALRAGPAQPATWYAAMLAVGPILFFTLLTLWKRGLPHWSMPGWLFAFPLFGYYAAELAGRRPVFARAYMAVSAGLFAVAVAAISLHMAVGLIPAGRLVDPTVELVDWVELPAALDERQLLGPETVVASPHWTFAGKASFALGPTVPVVCLCGGNARHFDFRYDRRQWAGRDAIVVVPRGRGDQGLWEDAARYFDRLEPLDPVEVTRAGRTVLILDLARGENLQFPGSARHPGVASGPL